VLRSSGGSRWIELCVSFSGYLNGACGIPEKTGRGGRGSGRLFMINRALAEFLSLSKLSLGQKIRTDVLLY